MIIGLLKYVLQENTISVFQGLKWPK